MNPDINTIAGEAFLKMLKDSGRINSYEIMTNVVIGSTHYMEYTITPNKPIDFINLSFNVELGKFNEL